MVEVIQNDSSISSKRPSIFGFFADALVHTFYSINLTGHVLLDQLFGTFFASYTLEEASKIRRKTVLLINTFDACSL